MNIATALNKKYIPYTTVMLTSLAMNNPGPLSVYLLHHELDDSDIATMEGALEGFSLEIMPLRIPQERFGSRLPYSEQWTIEAYDRLLLPELLQDKVERILYLDGDLIVNDSIHSFYNANISDIDLYVSKDANQVRTVDELLPKQQEMLGERIKNGYVYFNSGVVLMNIERLRALYQFSIYEKAFEEWSYEMCSPDQDILNYVHGEHVSYFDDEKYNQFARVAHNNGMSYDEVKRDCAIIHFAGDKPWESTNVHYDIEQLWWDYAQKTPLYHELLKGFLHSSMTNTVVEDYIIGLQKDNAELKATLMQVTEKMKELFG